MPPKGKSDPPESTVDASAEAPMPDADVWAEVERLERENAELRRQLAEANRGTVRLETSPVRIVLSQGIADDLERFGEVQDPASGYLLRRDRESGGVVVIDRKTGKPAQGVELAERRG